MFLLKALFFVAVLNFDIGVKSFTIQQVKDGQLYATECMIKTGISPLAVNKLAKGDLSRKDEKVQVSEDRFHF